MTSGRVHYQLIVWSGIIISAGAAAFINYHTPLGDPVLYWMIGLLGGIVGMGGAALKIAQDKIKQSKRRLL